MEMADVSMNRLRLQDAEINSHVLEDSEEEDFSLSKEVLPQKMRKEFGHSDADLGTYGNAIRCLHEGIELQEFQSSELEHQLMQEKQKNMETLTQRVHDVEAEFCEKHGESRKDLINVTEVFFELYKQLKLLVENLTGLVGQMTLTQNESCFSISELSKDAGKIDLKELTEVILCTIILLKKSLETEATSLEYDINSQDELNGRRIRDDNVFQNQVRDCSQELRNIHAKLLSDFPPPTKYQQVESEETNKLKSGNMLGKEKSCPRYSKLELEAGAAYLQSEISSNHSTDFPNDMKFHDWTKDSQTLMSKHVVRNLSFESSDDEDNALFGLKAENVQLSEKMLGLEAEMRHLIEEKE
ncbi:hypothetical protein JHK87_056959 [Glycine soja]|nr:hypothetical protein JHK87_056959 [Glycine soja]